MDPISASSFSLHTDEEDIGSDVVKPKKSDEKLLEIIISSRSLSQYEGTTIKCLLPQLLATAISASYHIAVGMALAYSAILIPQLRQTEPFPMTTDQSSWVASCIVLVVPFGAILGGFLMDYIGRLNTVKLAALPGLLGWILIGSARNVHMLIGGRLLTGLAAALGSSPAIVYITEIARADVRGSLISFAPVYASLGMVLGYLKGWIWDWRTLAWICIFYTVIPCILTVFIPESPVWLVAKGRIAQAQHALNWFNKYQPQPENKMETLAQMQLALLIKERDRKLNAERARSGAIYKLRAFLKPTGYKPLLILIGLFGFQQFSGIYITLFYSVSFFHEVGSSIDPYLASVLIGSVRLCMSIISTYLMRRINRRPLIMISATGMSICMLISGLFTQWIKNGTSDLTWVPVTAIILYVITSMIGLLPIPWTMTAELFPIEIRGVAHSIAYSMANVLMFLSVQSYESLLVWLGGAAGVQWLFSAIAIGGAIYTFVVLPETHRKKLTDIEQYFLNSTFCIGRNKITFKHQKQQLEITQSQQTNKLLQNNNNNNNNKP